MMGVGPIELLIIAGICAVPLLLTVLIVVVIVANVRRRK